MRVRSRAVRTHEPPAGAFRGFGAPQAIFAIEAHMDEVAARLRMDPVELRRRNLLHLGATTATGQVLRESVGIAPCLDAVLRESDVLARRAVCDARNAAGGDLAQGIGLALFWHGGGFTGAGERKMAPRAAIELQPSGVVEILVANTEFGQELRPRSPRSSPTRAACPSRRCDVACPTPAACRTPARQWPRGRR